MRLELHVHTRFSKDSFLCFFPLYIRCRLLGINGIAITDHNSIEGAVRFQTYCQKRGNKLTVIIGEEIFSSGGEIIGLYLNKRIEPDLSPEQTIEEILNQNGIVYVPHPFDTKRQKTVLKEDYISSFCKRIDCIEVHNGRNISEKFDKCQKKIATRYGIMPVIGSDAHTWIEIGRNYHMVSKIPVTTEEFLTELSHSEYVQKTCIPVSHSVTRIVKAIKILKTGGSNELYRIVFKRIKKN